MSSNQDDEEFVFRSASQITNHIRQLTVFPPELAAIIGSYAETFRPRWAYFVPDRFVDEDSANRLLISGERFVDADPANRLLISGSHAERAEAVHIFKWTVAVMHCPIGEAPTRFAVRIESNPNAYSFGFGLWPASSLITPINSSSLACMSAQPLFFVHDGASYWTSCPSAVFEFQHTKTHLTIWPRTAPDLAKSIAFFDEQLFFFVAIPGADSAVSFVEPTHF